MSKKQASQPPKTTPWPLVIGLIFWAFFALGIFFPDVWWGVNFNAFLPAAAKYGLLGISLGLLLFFHFRPVSAKRFSALPWQKSAASRWLIPLGGAVLAALLFYSFPIHADPYGDAPTFEEAFQSKIEKGENGDPALIFSPNILHPKNGERTVLNTVLLMTSEGDYQSAFRWFDAFWGGLFVFLWLGFLQVYLSSPLQRILLGLAGSTAPFIQVFFGHIEVYAPSFPLVGGTLMTIVLFLKTRKNLYFWLTFPLFFLAMKSHTSAFLLAPAVIGITVVKFVPKPEAFLEKINWKRVSLFVLLPLFATGAVLYFVILKDHVDPRFLGPDVSSYDRLFLPIVPPAAPYDRYTLLGFNHLFDFFNQLLIWSAAGMSLVIGLVVCFRKKINWQAPSLIFIGVTLILYFLFFFALNPLLGMPIDWDLLALPAPVLLVFAAVIMRQVPKTNLLPYFLGPMVALSLLSFPAFITNAQPEMLSQRMESLGVRVFKTYWIRSAGDMAMGLEMLSEKNEVDIERLLPRIEELEPYANEGNDVEFADLNWRAGKYYRRVETNPQKALEFHETAYGYAPAYNANLIGLVEAHFMLNQFAAAHTYSKLLIEAEYPSQPKALRMGIHCALEAQLWEEALSHASDYLAIYPEDEEIRYIWENLKAGTQLTELRRVFTG